jgi:organic hydroperoxide reductase OsmC/OhrA
MEDSATFSISATWDCAAKEGRVASPDDALSLVHVGARALDGKGGAPNPEELLLAAVTTCFAQTLAIFVEKLRLGAPATRVDGTAALEKDPAGGYRLVSIALSVPMPAALLAERKADVEKSLSLAERFCIISKAVKGSVPISVSARAA